MITYWTTSNSREVTF